MAERGGLRAAPAGATGSGGGQTESRELRAQGRPWPRGVSPRPTVSLPKATGGDNCPGGCWLGSPPPRHPNPPMHRGWKLSVTLNCFSAAFEKAGDPRAETKGFVCTNTISSGPKQLSGAVWPRPLRSLRRGRDGPGGKGGLRGGGGSGRRGVVWRCPSEPLQSGGSTAARLPSPTPSPPPPLLEFGDKSPPLYQPLVSFGIAGKDFINAPPAALPPSPPSESILFVPSVSSNHN